MTGAAVEVPDLAAALTIADRATSRWAGMAHHDDMNQAARIAIWRAVERGRTDAPLLYRTATAAAIDELRLLTGRRASTRALRRPMSIDHETFIEPTVELDPLSGVAADQMLCRLAGECHDQLDRDLLASMIGNDGAGGYHGESIAARHGVTKSALSHRRRRLRAVARSLAA